MTETTSCTRRLTFEAGHRVVGHEGKCASPHGHSYKSEIAVSAQQLDGIGRVIDFGVIKSLVGGWIDENWDHAFIVCERDQALHGFLDLFHYKVFAMPDNPTAENLAAVLFRVSVSLLEPLGIQVEQVTIQETENCWAVVKR